MYKMRKKVLYLELLVEGLPITQVFVFQGGWEHISVRGNSAERIRGPNPPPGGPSRSPALQQPATQVNGGAVCV